MTDKIIVVGIPTYGREPETWQFDGEDFATKFCENHVRTTGHQCFIIKGEVLAKFEVDDLPVKKTEFPSPEPQLPNHD